MGESANALLKILEEPPKNTIFILVTDKKSALLPTIMSRCQEIAFPILDLDTIRIMLEKRGVTNQHAIELAMIVDGDFHQAIDLADNNENFILEIKTLVNQVINVSESGWREFINDFSMMVCAFLTFRFFDIVKIWPTSWVDKNIHGGFGIMIDDIIAAAQSILVLKVAVFLLF